MLTFIDNCKLINPRKKILKISHWNNILFNIIIIALGKLLVISFNNAKSKFIGQVMGLSSQSMVT